MFVLSKDRHFFVSCKHSRRTHCLSRSQFEPPGSVAEHNVPRQYSRAGQLLSVVQLRGSQNETLVNVNNSNMIMCQRHMFTIVNKPKTSSWHYHDCGADVKFNTSNERMW